MSVFIHGLTPTLIAKGGVIYRGHFIQEQVFGYFGSLFITDINPHVGFCTIEQAKLEIDTMLCSEPDCDKKLASRVGMCGEHAGDAVEVSQ